jgi:hypothetical protein
MASKHYKGAKKTKDNDGNLDVLEGKEDMSGCSVDENSSVDDGIDHSKEENYAVKKFIGRKTGKKEGW